MTNKILIEAPERGGCLSCRSYNKECPACKLLYAERLAAIKKKVSDLAYVIVYNNWSLYLEAVRRPFEKGSSNLDKNIMEDSFVKAAKSNITRDLYPFFTPGSAKFCRSIWNAAIKDLSHRLWGFAPIIKVDVGKKKKRITLWY